MILMARFLRPYCGWLASTLRHANSLSFLFVPLDNLVVKRLPLDCQEEMSISYARPTYRPDSGNIGDADSEDADSDADAWLRYRVADRADQRRCLSRKSGVAAASAESLGTGWPREGRVASDREQPARSLLCPD